MSSAYNIIYIYIYTYDLNNYFIYLNVVRCTFDLRTGTHDVLFFVKDHYFFILNFYFNFSFEQLFFFLFFFPCTIVFFLFFFWLVWRQLINK